MEKTENSAVKTVIKFIRGLIGGFFAIAMFTAAVLQFVKTTKLSFAFMRAGVSAVPRVLSDYAMVLVALSLFALFARFGFADKLREKVSYKTLIACFFIVVALGTGMQMWDNSITDDFKWQKYAPYVETMPSKSAYAIINVDYDSSDVIRLDGYLGFLNNAFKDDKQIEVVLDDSFTDSLRIEAYYRGVECELYVSDYSEGEIHINLWEKEWSNETSIDDLIYMYRYKSDIEYSDKFVMEKLIIRTAYPEKIDISDISVY